jgi:hypothetical protein
MLILSGILDFGFLLFDRMSVINASREGARAAAMVSAAGDVDGNARNAAVASAASAGITINATSGVTVTCIATSTDVSSTTPVSGGCGSAKHGDSVRVKVDFSYPTFFPLLLGAHVPLSSTVQMVLDSLPAS